MLVRTKLSKEQYDFNKDSETHLLIELTAPKIEIKNRPPICVVPILDVSGSMAGQKIDYLRKACRKLIDNLAPGDFAGVVAFDSNVYEVAPIVEITQEQKEIIKKKVGELHAGSLTNLSGGLLKALEWVNTMDLPDKTVLRAIVFTDGQANVGLRGKDLLNMSVEKMDRVTISAFGFGTDCDQEGLASISNKCNGNYAFIDSADAALTAFGRELGGLMSVFGQDIKVSIVPDKNNKIIEILNDEDVEEKDGGATIKLRDILSEERKNLVVKVKLNEVDKPLPRKVNAFAINISFTNREGKEEILNTIPVKIKFCKDGEEPKEEDAEVVKCRDRLLLGKAQDQAETFARAGNYVSAYTVMNSCMASCSDADIKELAGTISSNYISDQSYTCSSGLNNSVRSILKGKRVSNITKDAFNLCSTAGAQKSKFIDDMADSFKEEEEEKDTTINPDITWTTTSIVPDNTVSTLTYITTKKRSGSDW